VFQNRVLRRIFGPKRDKVISEWRKLNEELNGLYCSPDIWVIKSSMRLTRHVAYVRERRGAYRVLGGKTEGKRLLARPRQRWEDNIKWIFRKLDGGAWIRLIWLRIGMGGRLL